MFKEKEDIVQKAWELYEKGKDYFNQVQLVDNTEKNNRFFIGDQWYNAQTGEEKLPMFNFIKGIVRYKVATITQNTMSAVYSNTGDKSEDTEKACELLTDYFSRTWENTKMDSKAWEIIKQACIEDSAYLYFGSGNVEDAQIISTTNIMLADEQNSNLQEQEYIIIPERLPVNAIRKEARKNGIAEEELINIISDEEKDLVVGNDKEVQTDDGKCTSLLFLYKDEEGIVNYFKTTNRVLYSPVKKIQGTDIEGNYTSKGLKMYPIVNFVWEQAKGSARGCGEVRYLIPNQLELNKTLARRSISIKQTAFSRIVYSSLVTNADDLDKVGAKIKIDDPNAAYDVNKLVSYLNPQSQSADAKNFSDELITMTKELAGAGDAVTGGVNPETASGQSIIAARDQAALPLNEQVASYKQFIEDIARLWFEIWIVYNPNGLVISSENEQGEAEQLTIPTDLLESMKINIRVDVSQNSPYSKYAREMALDKLFDRQAITFDEYVDALDKDSIVPKAKLQDIVDKRAEQERIKNALANALDIIKQQQEMMGGATNEMQTMQPGNEYRQG